MPSDIKKKGINFFNGIDIIQFKEIIKNINNVGIESSDTIVMDKFLASAIGFL
jgi:hypothetical protein